MITPTIDQGFGYGQGLEMQRSKLATQDSLNAIIESINDKAMLYGQRGKRAGEMGSLLSSFGAQAEGGAGGSLSMLGSLLGEQGRLRNMKKLRDFVRGQRGSGYLSSTIDDYLKKLRVGISDTSFGGGISNLMAGLTSLKGHTPQAFGTFNPINQWKDK